MNILVVEDDLKLAGVMRRLLMEARHTVDVTEDGWAGRTLATMGQYDVIILDRLLPSMDGLEVCRQIRAVGIITPVLICSAYADLDDCVAGLEVGADDYLAKPFAMQELLARVNALGRWSRKGESTAHRAPQDAVDGAASLVGKHDVYARRMPGLATHLRQAWTASRHWLWWGGEHADDARDVAMVGAHGVPAHCAGQSDMRKGERV